MKIIDARSGVEVQIGVPVTYPDMMFFHGPGHLTPMGKDPSNFTLLDVKEGLLSATALFRFEDGREEWHPLIVRILHPGFFLQKVAFIPS